MRDNKKSRPVLAHGTGERQGDVSMSLSNLITKCRESKAYFRRLVVRAIEDGIILFGICVAIAVVCYVCGSLLTMMGVQ